MENVAKCQKPNITGGLERWKANEMSHVCFIDVYSLHPFVTEVGEQNIQNIHPPGFCDVTDVFFFCHITDTVLCFMRSGMKKRSEST